MLAGLLLNKLNRQRELLEGGHRGEIKRIDAHFIIWFSASCLCYLQMALSEIHCLEFTAFRWPDVLNRGALKMVTGEFLHLTEQNEMNGGLSLKYLCFLSCIAALPMMMLKGSFAPLSIPMG